VAQTTWQHRWYMQAYRERKRGGPARPYGVKKTPKLRPFIGVDGEGAGTNRHGQQHYMLFRVGDRELYTGKPLETRAILEHILAAPKDAILVGYGFNYDASQIIGGIYDPADPERYHDRLAFLFRPKEQGPGVSRYMRWEDYGIEYLPRNYLRVSRQERFRSYDPQRGISLIGYRTVEGSARTIYDTIGFFQCTFLQALKNWGIGPEHWAAIEQGKSQRDGFVRITRTIRKYNDLECQLLAQLMERFRAVCTEAGLKPATWNGAGKLAAYLHKANHTITRAEVNKRTPSGVLRFANDAYYGGRFETPYIGEIPGPVYAYDVRSAYPTAMRDLPCLLHGGWIRQNRAQLAACHKRGGLYVARVHFKHPPHTFICGLPIRQKSGRLFWPLEGQGVYWSTELRSAERLGAKITWLDGWRYDTRCQCKAFDWVEPLYEFRRSLADLRGVPIKLGLNSLYGKLAQRVGDPRYGNMIHAGLITAATRARLNEAASQNPHAMLMFATDGLFSREPLALETGERLGQWEAEQYPRLFIVQPGLYWGAKRAKTRGIPSEAFMDQHKPRFERAWFDWLAGGRAGPPPSVRVPVKMFVGIRLAHAWGKPEMARRWVYIGSDGRAEEPGADEGKRFSFDWRNKRDGSVIAVRGNPPQAIETWPAAGGRDLVSQPHKGSAAHVAEAEMIRLAYAEQPDFVTPAATF
jgi:hypothetical protein